MTKLEDVYNAVRKILPEGELYAVGGCVRDSILGKEPKDYDFCTSLTPEQMKPMILEAGRHYYGIGERFGTVGFRCGLDDGSFQYVEVTTYRSEKYQPKNRHPIVEFGDSLEKDLSRRDFTINAMAYSPEEGIIDLYGGRLNILDKVVKPVGKAKDRFKEDPLRMLRAVRFATILGFDIEQNMLGEIKKNSLSLLDVAVERWIIELDKILFSENPNRGVRLLDASGLWSVIFPEIDIIQVYQLNLDVMPAKNEYRYRHIIRLSGNYWKKSKKYTEGGYWANDKRLAQYVGKGICERLKLSNIRKELILQ